jgi:hypothetical protein
VVRSGPEDLGVAGAVPPTVLGRPVRVLTFRVGCAVEASAQAAREIATDPPDGPPVVGAIAAICPRAALPVAQILEESGIALLVTGDPPSSPAPLDFSLLHSEPVAAAAALVEAAGRVAVQHEGSLLVPRTELRDGLRAEGLSSLQVAGRAGAVRR